MRSRACKNATSVLSVIVVSLAMGSCTFGPPPSGHPFAGGSPSKSCAECHSAIYNEWRLSAHAGAYTRPEFRLATHDYKDKDCLTCHVPASLDALTEKPVRTARLDEGINCESCHLTDGAYGAPTLFSEYSNHKMVVRADLATSAFCGRCHEAIFAQWSKVDDSTGGRRTCQQCHMPALRRKTVSGSVWHTMHPEGDTRRHGFAMVVPEAGKANVTVSVAVDVISPQRVAGRVTLTNVAAQHSLPSGEFGFRELAVVVALTDRYGVASAKRVVRFLAQKRNYLAYGQPREVTFDFDTVPADATTLDVKLIRSAFSGVEAELYHKSEPLSRDEPGTAGK